MRERIARPNTIRLLGLGALCLTLAACSISTDTSARPIDDVPDDILSTTTTTIVEAVEPDESGFTMLLYFYSDEQQLILVERPVEETPRLQEVLEGLRGLGEEEQEELPGVSTRLLPDVDLTLSELDDSSRVLTVGVPDASYRELVDTNPGRVQRIYSQIVCTMTAANPTKVETVQIRDAEGPIRVQDTRSGAVVEEPIGPEAVNDCKTAEDLAAEVVSEADDGESEEEGEGTSTTTAG